MKLQELKRERVFCVFCVSSTSVQIPLFHAPKVVWSCPNTFVSAMSSKDVSIVFKRRSFSQHNGVVVAHILKPK